MKRKQIQEMEERIKKRKTKSEKQVINHNPLGVNDDEYDTKVYKGEIKKERRASEVEEIEEGMQMVFNLPTISTKKAKELHKMVRQNIIREDRRFRTQCSQTERAQNQSSLSLTRQAQLTPLDFSMIKNNFKRRLNVR